MNAKELKRKITVAFPELTDKQRAKIQKVCTSAMIKAARELIAEIEMPNVVTHKLVTAELKHPDFIEGANSMHAILEVRKENALKYFEAELKN